MLYIDIIKRGTKAAGRAESPRNHEPYPREEEPTARRTIAGKMLMGLPENLLTDRKENIMGERALQNRIMKLRELEAQQKALEEQAEKIRQEIKADMEAKQVEEMKAGSFVIRWKTILSSRLDGKALRAALPEIYNQYCKASESRRFTIA